MFWAWRLIRRQLGRTPGMLAYMTGMATLTEFYTLTLWEKEFDMTLFMASEDHRDMMWNVRRWSDSFWSMRWNGTTEEVGTWNGKSFAHYELAASNKPQYLGPGYMESREVPETLRPYLRNIIRNNEPETLDVGAVIGRIPTPSIRSIGRLKRTLEPWRSEANALRVELALGWKECLLFIVWKERGEHDSRKMMDVLMRQFPDAWAMRFPATDFEIGHWNRLRIREYADTEADKAAAE
jgi:hypothetical protein